MPTIHARLVLTPVALTRSCSRTRLPHSSQDAAFIGAFLANCLLGIILTILLTELLAAALVAALPYPSRATYWPARALFMGLVALSSMLGWSKLGIVYTGEGVGDDLSSR